MRNSLSAKFSGKNSGVKAIYCYNDIEIEAMLFLLNSYYGTPEKAEELIEKGNVNELKETLDKSNFFSGNLNVPRKYTDLTDASKKEFADYFYYFNGDHWGIVG